jgi:hypothetical protein
MTRAPDSDPPIELCAARYGTKFFTHLSPSSTPPNPAALFYVRHMALGFGLCAAAAALASSSISEAPALTLFFSSGSLSVAAPFSSQSFYCALLHFNLGGLVHPRARLRCSTCSQKELQKMRPKRKEKGSDLIHCCSTPAVLLLLRLALFGAQWVDSDSVLDLCLICRR